MTSKNLRLALFSVCLLSGFLNSGCLRTRGEAKEQDQRQVMQEQVSTLQQRNADSAARFSEVQESLREMSGRISNVELQMNQLTQNEQGVAKLATEQNQALKRQIDLLQEEMAHLQAAMTSLQQEANSAKIQQPSSAANVSASASSNVGRDGKKSTFHSADEHFSSKDWKRAIVGFQKFREESPNSSKVPEAIYRIGVSFQELGMREEAKAFFDEAIAKYPTTEGARKSKIRLKSLR